MTKILLAATTALTRKIVELTFADNATVTIVEGGGQVVSLAKAQQPDVILCEVLMPKLNGYEVTAALKADEATRAIPVILLTGFMEPFDKKRARQAGAADWIYKTSSAEKLIGMVQTHAGGYPPPGTDPNFPDNGPPQGGRGGWLKRLFGPREH